MSRMHGERERNLAGYTVVSVPPGHLLPDDVYTYTPRTSRERRVAGTHARESAGTRFFSFLYLLFF